MIACFLCDACSSNPYKSGEVLYESFCAGCHGTDGLGLGDFYPPIKDSDYLKEHADKLTCMIRDGMIDTIMVNGKTYREPMPAIPRLNDVAITNINNYINYAWPYREGATTIVDVRAALKKCN